MIAKKNKSQQFQNTPMAPCFTDGTMARHGRQLSYHIGNWQTLLEPLQDE
jgi:hypothetical protein